MAKQRGIHQISGKINNLCYYEQKYVRGGLIRRINEAMSERLKTDPVFENTRYANKIFGGCSQYAKALLSFFGSRNTYLFLPFRQARLTEIIRKNCLSDYLVNTFPSIDLVNVPQPLSASLFDSIFKNPLRKNFPSIPLETPNLSLNSSYDFVFPIEELSNFCNKYKCKKLQITISNPHFIYNSKYVSLIDSYDTPQSNPGGRGFTVYWEDTDSAEDLRMTVSTGDVYDAFSFWIIYVTPVLREKLGRPITGETGASVGIVRIYAE